jgi:hypothetical protein
MIKPLLLVTFVATAFYSCTTRQPAESSAGLPIEGTWQLLSETKIEIGDTTFTPASKDIPMVKVLNKTHFTFLRHDLLKGKDSTALFVAGGGRYELRGDQYTEHLEYCSARDWENNDFHFTVTIEGDTLVQQGQEKVEGTDIDRIIIEKYSRVK